MNIDIGYEIHQLAKTLWPINRSITGNGIRETLQIIKGIVPNLNIVKVPSGTTALDWTVPEEWNVKEAFIIDPNGNRILDFSINNLHLVGYSTPVNKKLDLSELEQHLYSLPEQPTAIPYVTSYYKKRWGFCLSHQQRQALKPGMYQVVIDSQLTEGYMDYGEIILPGTSNKEVFLSTYVCHPSMANNELSGPCVTVFLAQWLQKLKSRNFTYRIVFIPETIGSILYLSRNLDHLKKHVIAGFNISCIGDNRSYSYLPSRDGDTYSDKIAKHVLRMIDSNFIQYSWRDRGSDERQYCAPGIDLPIASIMRTKYGQYPEYHTSLDNLHKVVTAEGLTGGYYALQKALEAIERNIFPKIKILGEPQLGKRGLYPDLSQKNSSDSVKLMMDLITYSDGKRSLLEIAELCEAPVWKLYSLLDKLIEHNIMSTTPYIK